MLRLSTGLLFLLALCGIGSAAAQDNNLDISGALSNLPEEIGAFLMFTVPTELTGILLVIILWFRYIASLGRSIW